MISLPFTATREKLLSLVLIWAGLLVSFLAHAREVLLLPQDEGT